MKNSYPLIIFCSALLLGASVATSQVLQTKSLPSERSYETVILKGNYFELFNNTPVNHLYLYAYSKNESAWKPIPFQIDELDPTIADAPDQLFDNNDELLFLAQDLGDKVSPGNWIDDADSKSYKRYEIEVVDSRDKTKRGWCYLYRSATLTEQNKSPIRYLNYNATLDSVIGKYYVIGNRRNWFPQTILITSDGKGDGKDFYDRTKLRIRAIPFPGADLFFDETKVLIKSAAYIKAGPIRIQRRDSLKFDIPNFEYSATFTRKYFPYYSNFSGKVELQAQWLFKALRMSYDLDPRISGAKFYSGDSSGIKNRDIIVDGISDAGKMNLVLKGNSPNWTMITGQFGTLLTINSVIFERDPSVTDPYNQSLYYWDDKSNNPLPMSRDYDTGDGLSYGDHGMLFESYNLAGIITYNSATYFLPANQATDVAENMFYNFNSPMILYTEAQQYAAKVADRDEDFLPIHFKLLPNYPNPFNTATTIAFELDRADWVKVEIYDVHGRKLITLANKSYQPGIHRLTWNGRDEMDQPVSSGIYVCKAKSSRNTASQKIALIK